MLKAAKLDLFNVPLSRFISCLQQARRFLYLGEHFTQGSPQEIELTRAVPIAGRKYLPSPDSPDLPKFLSGPKENFPLLVKAVNAEAFTIQQWGSRSREIIDEAYREYDKHGTVVAILFRGLPIVNAQDFSAWGKNIGFQPFSYVGGVTARHEISENVANGALDGKNVTIEPHNEMAYSVRHPKVVAISCFKKASWGGETAICDNRNILANLDPSVVEKCEQKKIRYWHYLPHEDNEVLYQSWQMHFQTNDLSAVENYLRDKKYDFEWEGENLFYWNNLPPFNSHSRSGERLWFNQISGQHSSYFVGNPDFEGVKITDPRKYPNHTTYGDGKEFEQDVIDEIRGVTWKNAVGFDWNEGDVLLVDQLIVQHSRLSFEGERSVGVSLFNY